MFRIRIRFISTSRIRIRAKNQSKSWKIHQKISQNRGKFNKNINQNHKNIEKEISFLFNVRKQIRIKIKGIQNTVDKEQGQIFIEKEMAIEWRKLYKIK